ncbi:MAG: cold-shock protein, partial [Alphaproteobacteria bacterium]
ALDRALGRPRSALQVLESLTSGRVGPRSRLAVTVHRAIADIAWEHGDVERTKSALADALANDPDDGLLLGRLAEVDREAPPPRRDVVDGPVSPEIMALLDARPSRHHGRVASYFSDRGFGFISPSDGDRSVFFHVSHAPADGVDRIREGLAVSYVVAKSQRTGKTQAEEILFEDGFDLAEADAGDEIGSEASRNRPPLT